MGRFAQIRRSHVLHWDPVEACWDCFKSFGPKKSESDNSASRCLHCAHLLDLEKEPSCRNCLATDKAIVDRASYLSVLANGGAPVVRKLMFGEHQVNAVGVADVTKLDQRATVSYESLLRKFLSSCYSLTLRTSDFPKTFGGFSLRVSFGQGTLAAVPWMSFLADGQSTSNGFYPVLLFFREENKLILAFGVSETSKASTTWSPSTVAAYPLIEDCLNDPPRYGKSWAHSVYDVKPSGNSVLVRKNGLEVTARELNAALLNIFNTYRSDLDKTAQEHDHEVARPDGLVENSERMLALKKRRNALAFQGNTTYDIQLRFEDGGDQLLQTARRITGLVRLKQMGRLIQALDLDANPRNSKVGDVTRAIRETLEMTPELFPIKSKGILLGSSDFQELGDRNRFNVNFVNRDLEGVLDGGHNLLAIGLFLLEHALTEPKDQKALAKVRIWSDLKELVQKHSNEFVKYLESGAAELDIKVWVELIVPPADDEVAIENFEGALLDIQEARNNNAQLTQATKTDKAGYFDYLKNLLDPEIAEKIEWKGNDGGKVKVGDLVALAWIPLMALELFPKDESGKNVVPPSPVQLYSQKSTCISRFDDFMSSPEVTTRKGAEPTLDNLAVKSALRLAADMPRIYDYVSGNLPDAYNRVGGRYGNIGAVAALNRSSRGSKTKFTEQAISKKSPEGFLAPVVYAMRANVLRHDDGTVEWAMDPFSFLSVSLDSIVRNLKEFITNVGDEESSDPQKVGKNPTIYTSCFQAAQLSLMAAKAR